MRFRIASLVLYWADEEPIRKIFHVLLDHKNVEVTTHSNWSETNFVFEEVNSSEGHDFSIS